MSALATAASLFPNRLFLIADLSSPVCLFCGSRHTAKVYLLDINKKEMRTLDVDVSSQSHYFSLVHLTQIPCLLFRNEHLMPKSMSRQFLSPQFLINPTCLQRATKPRVTHIPSRERRLFGLFWRLIKHTVFS